MAETIATRACKHLQQSNFCFEQQNITVTASFGVAAGDSQEPLSKLLANADVALYEAKRNGRNRVEVYQN